VNGDGAPQSEVLLGIDPGLRVTGYGLVAVQAGNLAHLDHGAIRTRLGDHAARLLEIFRGVTALLTRWSVNELAIEKQFVALNASSAFAIGEARAVCILAAAIAGVPVFEYTPTEVKQSVTSYGRSAKGQVQEVIRMQLGLRESPEPLDAADALAAAVCHAALRRRPRVPIRR
jgi:crossover junction endodeoxyribonuclease RuvC